MSCKEIFVCFLGGAFITYRFFEDFNKAMKMFIKFLIRTLKLQHVDNIQNIIFYCIFWVSLSLLLGLHFYFTCRGEKEIWCKRERSPTKFGLLIDGIFYPLPQNNEEEQEKEETEEIV